MTPSLSLLLYLYLLLGKIIVGLLESIPSDDRRSKYFFIGKGLLQYIALYSTSLLSACIVFVDNEEDQDEGHFDIISSLLEVFHALLLSNCYPTAIEVLSNCYPTVF